MAPTKCDKHSLVPGPLRKPNILLVRIERCSIHQSSLDLIICSVILHSDEDKEIGQIAFKFGPDFGIGMTLNWLHVAGTVSFKKRLLIILSKKSKAQVGPVRKYLLNFIYNCFYLVLILLYRTTFRGSLINEK